VSSASPAYVQSVPTTALPIDFLLVPSVPSSPPFFFLLVPSLPSATLVVAVAFVPV